MKCEECPRKATKHGLGFDLCQKHFEEFQKELERDKYDEYDFDMMQEAQNQWAEQRAYDLDFE